MLKNTPGVRRLSLTSGVLFLYSNPVTRPKFEWHGRRRIHHLFW